MPLPIIDFAPFQLDLRAGQLCRDGVPVPLRPKTFAVLEHLVQRPGELVTKQALLDAVWGDVAVSEDVVRLSVGELRTALGDERAAPRFIETVPRRGYRFVAQPGTLTPERAAAPAAEDSTGGDGTLVGRSRESSEIAEWLRVATSGRRQIGFVTGEAGIGKTTLVDTVLRDLRRASGARLRIACGQCIEQYGGGAAYLPVLDALGALCRGADGPAVEVSLRAHAPDWLVHELAPWAPRSDGPAESTAGTPEHMLQRLATSLDALASDIPLVLILEDMQWSDHSTLDLLSVLAHRREPARLLVLCTLRPADAIVHGHPVSSVKRELVRTGRCREIILEGLPAADVATYLNQRFPGAQLAEDIVSLVVERCEGNPFFMVALVDHLLERGLLVRIGDRWELHLDAEARTVIPEGLRAVIEPRLERLAADELHLLEVASVAGPEFAAHAVARASPPSSDLGDVEYVERLCDAHVRRQEILRPAGESVWPDGAESGQYAFRHALYQQVTYQRLSSSVRRRLHQTIGDHLEAAYAGRTADVASELAAHFERSLDGARAVRYHDEAAALARSRSACREARLHLEAALGILGKQPETPERLRQEMACLQDLGQVLFTIEGWGGEAGARVFARMRQRAEDLEGDWARFRAMEGEVAVHTMRAEFDAARPLSADLLALAERLGDRAAIANAHVVRSATLFNCGEVEGAHHHAERAQALFDPATPPQGADSGILASVMLATTCGYRGRIVQARAHYGDALARAETLGVPFQRGLAINLTAQLCTFLNDVPGARRYAEEAEQLASEHDFSFLRVTAAMIRGWCDVVDGRGNEGLTAMRAAFQEYGESGQRFGTTCYSMFLAGAHLASGDAAGANRVLEDALAFAAETGERVYEPELYRLRGECLLAGAAARGRTAAAAAWFERALRTAAERQAFLFELRAATSLSRIRKSARELLVRLVDRFDAADDCADLRAARAALM